MSRPSRIEVPAAAAGERLDRYLAAALDLPRNRVQRWISDGDVTIDGRAAKPSFLLAGGELLVVRPPASTGGERVEPEHGPLEVLYEDDAIVVVDKPAGLAVHPGAGRAGGTLANRILAAYPEMASVGGPGRPGIVHRLDLDTTGLLLLARTDSAYRRLSDDFASRRVDKTYLAICYGRPSPTPGEYTGPIGRHPQRRKQMAVRPGGRPARTTYERLAEAGGVSLLRVGLDTGRTHQIRVHFKVAGHPLVGDPVYGEARWKAIRGAARGALRAFPRPALHAWKLGFAHPARGEPMTLVAAPPVDLAELWRAVSEGGELEDVLA